MIFEKKKLQIETLSEYLSEIRKNLNLPAGEVCRKAGMSLKFLEGLETGQLKNLPADVYVYGFLRQLGTIYAVDADVLISQYKKERGIVQQLDKNQDNVGGNWRKNFNKLIITPKLLTIGASLLFIVLTVGYIVWQVWSINKTPSLTILSPADNSVIAGSAVEIRGQTDAGMSVEVNSQPVFVDSKGEFRTELALSAGPRQISITAKNRFNKSVSRIVNITAQPGNSSAVAGMELRLDFAGRATVSFVLDDGSRESLSFNEGDAKILAAKQKIILSTSDAGATRVTFNGQILGFLGRKGEALNNIPFLTQTDSAKNGE